MIDEYTTSFCVWDYLAQTSKDHCVTVQAKYTPVLFEVISTGQDYYGNNMVDMILLDSRVVIDGIGWTIELIR